MFLASRRAALFQQLAAVDNFHGSAALSLQYRAYHHFVARSSSTPHTSKRIMVSADHPVKAQDPSNNKDGVASRSVHTPSARAPLVMIPGPIEYHPAVLSKLAEPTLSHMSPGFIKEFGDLLKGIRTVLKGGEDSQPVVLSGSGTLGWDVIVGNLCERGDAALVINTGYFSDSYAVCAENYGVKVHQVKCENIGDTVSEAQLEKYLSNTDVKFKLICITQVDTSTAVVNDVATLARTAKKHQPEALISVDGVCSFGGEKFHFEEWGIDAGMSCSQKALGAPPGLSILLFSKRALQSFEQRDTTVASYYANLHNWLPIMRSHEQLKPSYFGTPNVNLIRAMNISIQQLLKFGVDKLIDQHITTAKKFRAAMKALNLKFVATAPDHSANTLSAIYYPAGLKREAFLPAALKRSVVLAGGLHKDIKPDYFRVGHMGYSVWGDNDFMEKTVEAIEGALIEAGADVKEGTAIKAYQSASQKSAA